MSACYDRRQTFYFPPSLFSSAARQPCEVTKNFWSAGQPYDVFPFGAATMGQQQMVSGGYNQQVVTGHHLEQQQQGQHVFVEQPLQMIEVREVTQQPVQMVEFVQQQPVQMVSFLAARNASS